MRLPCPFCGLRDAAEFTYEGPSAPRPPLDAPVEAWVEAVHLREQPRGRCEELWRHAHGCRSLMIVERDNVTHEVFAARLAHPGMAASLEAEDAPETDAATPARGNGAAHANGGGSNGAGHGGRAAANGNGAGAPVGEAPAGGSAERRPPRRRSAGGAEDAAGGGGGGGA